MAGSSSKGWMDQVMLLGMPLLSLPWVQSYVPNSTSKSTPSQGLLTLILLT